MVVGWNPVDDADVDHVELVMSKIKIMGFRQNVYDLITIFSSG